MTRASARTAALLVYLLPVVGWLYAWLFLRRHGFVFYHACQALGLVLVAILAPVAWMAFSWLAAWVPLFGPITAAGSFALVVAAYIVLVPAWIMGVVHALRLEPKAVPIYGGWGNRIYTRLTPAA